MSWKSSPRTYRLPSQFILTAMPLNLVSDAPQAQQRVNIPIQKPRPYRFVAIKVEDRILDMPIAVSVDQYQFQKT